MYSSVGDENGSGIHSLSGVHMKALEISSTDALEKLSLNNSAKTQNTGPKHRISKGIQLCKLQ